MTSPPEAQANHPPEPTPPTHDNKNPLASTTPPNDNKTYVMVEQKPFWIEQVSWKPRVFYLQNILTPFECDFLMQRAKDELTRSTVVDEASGSSTKSTVRTSQGMFIPKTEPHPVLQFIQRKLSRISYMPTEHAEDMQILKYEVGEEYEPHFDFFDSSTTHHSVLDRGGQRVATIIMFLTDIPEGGETIFPEVGIKIPPRRGNGILFFNMTPDHQLDRLSRHGGAPVKVGEKWVATQWLRERTFTSSYGSVNQTPNQTPSQTMVTPGTPQD